MSLVSISPLKGASQRSRPPQVRIELIGRANAGKTVLLHALMLACVGRRFPSKLYTSAGSPQKVNELRMALKQSLQDIRTGRLPSTLQMKAYDYSLVNANQTVAQLLFTDVIGQVFTGTTSTSTPDEIRNYDASLKRLANSNVVLVTVPSKPAQSSRSDEARFQDDLLVADAWLQQCLLDHGDRPVSVALVITKIDARFPTADEARDQYSPELIRAELAPLICTIDSAPNVIEAAAFPTSSFGMGNSIRQTLEIDGDMDELPDDSAEAGYLLARSAPLEPFNLASLLAWSILSALLQEPPTPDHEALLAESAMLLSQDLEALETWVVPLRGRIFGNLS